MTDKSLAEAIRSARDQKRMTQAELAERVDVYLTTVRRWESGTSIPERKHQRKLIEILGLDASLFEEAEKAAEKKSEQPPDHLWHVPHRNPFFTGRDDILSLLHAALTSGTTAALTQAQAMCGLGGIGKTQAALEYVYHYADDYETIFWIRADPPGLLLADYTVLAEFLGVSIPDEADQDNLVRAVKRGLSARRNWLLVLDNVEDFGRVRDVLPVAGQGHVLLTTRAQDTGGLAHPIAVDTMSLEVGALLLLRRAEQLDRASGGDMELAQRISGVMGGLPLALVQAGAYISATGCGLAGYLDRYEKQRAKLLGQRDEFNLDYPESVATTWSLSFEKVEQASPAAADVLRLCAFLDGEAIPEEMIIDSARQLGPFLQEVTNTVHLDDCMRTLLRYSFVQRDVREKTFGIHRLVQAVQMDSMEEETQRLWAERAMHAVNRALPYVEAGTETQQQGQRCIAHAQVVCQSIKQHRITTLEAARLLNKTGRYLREHAQYVEAEALCRESLRLYETHSSAPQEELAYCCTDLALIAERLGNRTEAENFYGKAWTWCERRYGAEHPRTATAHNNIAAFYLNQGRYSEAEAHFKQASDIYIKTEGVDSLNAASSRLSLAELYSQAGLSMEAEQLYKEVLALRERFFDPDHLRVGNVLNRLAGCYERQGRLDEAEPLCQRAVAIYEQHLGPEHHAVTYPLMTLATIYERQGKSSEAEAFFNKALRIREQVLGTDHPEVAAALKGLALVYRSTGKLHDAQVLCERALIILEKISGPEHPHLIDALFTLALLCLEQEHDSEADQFVERLLVLAAQLQGLEHARVISDLIIIGTHYLDRRQYDKARSLYQRMLTLAIQVVGSDHSIIITLQIYLARACEYQGDDDTANSSYFIALHRINQQQQRGNEYHPDTLKLLQWYSSFLRSRNRDEEAALVEAMMERVR